MRSLWPRQSRRRHDLSQKDRAPNGMGHAPELVTERLRLRMPRLEDFEHRAAFYASDRVRP